MYNIAMKVDDTIWKIDPQLVEAIKQHSQESTVRTKIVAIDGCGGAGKSTVAEKMAAALDAPIVHTDDFASLDHPLDWWPRMIEQVLKPLEANQSARYQRYDWDEQQLAEWVTIPPSDYLILEGVSSSRLAFDSYLAFRIWVDTNREVRLARGIERDGEAMREQWGLWMADEDAYVASDDPVGRADLVILGESDVPHDVATEIVVARD